MVAAFTLWFPATSVPIAGRQLQPAELVGLFTGVVLLPILPNLGVRRIAPVLLAYLSWIWAWVLVPDGDRAGILVLYYSMALGPMLLLFAIALADEAMSRNVILGLAGGGLVSCTMGIAQRLFGVMRLDFRTNDNFGLPGQQRRVFAFFPEASALAALTQVLLAVLLANALAGNPARLPRLLRSPLMVMTVITLALTRSTSVFVILPVLLFVTVLGSPIQFGRKVRTMIALPGLLAIGGLFYYSTLYSVRLERSSGLRSGNARLSTITSALVETARHPLGGVGLGENRQVQSIAVSRVSSGRFPGLSISDGVNSLTFSRMFEEGAFALVATAWAAVALLLLYRHRPRGIRFVNTTLLLGAALAGTFVSGYRGLTYAWLWYLAPVLLYSCRRDGPSARAVTKADSRFDPP